jgi:hypothetical protein
MGLWICYSVTMLTLPTLLMSYYPVSVAIIFLCCLRWPYVYRGLLGPASIDRVLVLGRPVRRQARGFDRGQGVLGVGDGWTNE